MATGNNDIDRNLAIPVINETFCIIKYIGGKFNTTVKATGRRTTLEQLQEDFPTDNIQPCQEDNIQYYRTLSKEGPQFFVCQKDESKEKVYYWRDGHWHGYKTLKSVEFTQVQPENNAENRSSHPQPPADDREH